MRFVEIKETEYEKYWESHPLKTFLSSPDIGKLREKNKWQVNYVAVKDKNKILCATMLVSIIKKFGKREYYSPRGFLIDFHDKELLDFFVRELKNYIKKNNGYVLRIDPYLIYKERDIDGNIVDGGEDNSNVVKHLQNLGFKKVNISNLEQVGWMFSLDLEGKTEEQIMMEMRQNTRNTIKKASKIGIEIKELEYDELQRFQDIIVETGERRKFPIRKLSYYQDMYNLLHAKGQIKYLVTELNLDKYIERLQNEKKDKEEELSGLRDTRHNAGKKKTLLEDIEVFNKRIMEAEKIKEESGKNVITMSGAMFIMIKPEVLYLFSGNYIKYMQFNSQYLIQWEMIRYGIANGFKKYNFYGIPANINKKPEDYGVYEFKKGFNGYVEELIGEFELPISPLYYVLKLIRKFRKK